MSDYKMDELARLEWMQSRIPARDALVRFVPDGARGTDVDSLVQRHRSRWYPLKGGHRVVVAMENKPEYDPTKWQVEKGIWDHEHCDLCGESVLAMTLCWVTKYDPYVLLCDACHGKLAAYGLKGT